MPKMLRLTESIADSTVPKLYISFTLLVFQYKHTFTHIFLFQFCLTSPRALLSLTRSPTIQTLFQDQFDRPAAIVGLIKLQTKSQAVAKIADRTTSYT